MIDDLLKQTTEISDIQKAQIYSIKARCFEKQNKQVECFNHLVFGSCFSIEHVFDRLTSFCDQNNFFKTRAARIYLVADKIEDQQNTSSAFVKAYLLSKIYLSMTDRQFVVTDHIYTADEEARLKRFTRENTQACINHLYADMLAAQTQDYTMYYEALCWLIESQQSNDDIIGHIESYLSDHLSDQESSITLALLLGRYYFQRENHTEAVRCFSIINQYELARTKKFQDFHDHFRTIYRTQNNSRALNALNELLANQGDGEYFFQQAQELLTASKDEPNHAKLLQIIDCYKRAALQKHAGAMAELSKLEQAKHPEAVLAKIEVLEKVGKYKAGKEAIRDSFYYPKKNYCSEMQKDVLASYEARIKKGDLNAYLNVARLRYQGKLFKKNFFIARHYFKKIYEANMFTGYVEYASLCFYGEGGEVDVETARIALEAYLQSDEADHSSTEFVTAHYLLGEIYYLDYLFAQHQENDELMRTHAMHAIECFKVAADKGDQKAFLSLVILSQQGYSLTSDLDALRHQHSQFVQLGVEPGDDPVASSFSEDDVFQEATNALSNNDPQPLLECIINKNSFAETAFDLLLRHYRDKEKGLLFLITLLCQDAKQYSWEDQHCEVLRSLITSIDPVFNGKDLSFYQQHLYEAEAQYGDYFDDHYSDDSDDEDEVSYQGNTGHNTADYERAVDLTAHIEAPTLKMLKAILSPKSMDDERIKTLSREIKSLFKSTEYWMPNQPTAHHVINQDLLRLNNHFSIDQRDTAMRLISTDFCVALARGIHFKKEWHTTQRNSYCRLIRALNHPLHRQIHYSAAVHEHAGVFGFADFSEIENLQLEKSARFVYLNLLRANNQTPLQEIPEELDLKKLLGSYRYDSLADQMQRLYSVSYDKFHGYLQYAAKQPHTAFVSTGNPVVSSGAMSSIHSARYAYGKTYEDHRSEVLKPLYDVEGKARYTAVGAIILFMLPITDFARHDYMNVVAMNTSGRIQVNDLVLSENEFSFFSKMPGSIPFVVKARYPSFHRTDYLRVQHYKYGLSEDLYKAFRQAILKTKPHDKKRELVELLLTEYLCAYHTLYLTRYAHEYCKKRKLVMIYPNSLGGFSSMPTQDKTSNPNGYCGSDSARRDHIRELREKRKGPGFWKPDGNASQYMSTNPSASPIRKRTHGSDDPEPKKRTRLQ